MDWPCLLNVVNLRMTAALTLCYTNPPITGALSQIHTIPAQLIFKYIYKFKYTYTSVYAHACLTSGTFSMQFC